MRNFCVRGVVRGGQIVVEVPLDLPDGTAVTVTDRSAAEIEVTGANATTAAEAAKCSMLNLLNRLDLLNDPDWQAKVENDRIAFTQEIILQIAGMWRDRPEMADPEQWVRRQRGARE